MISLLIRVCFSIVFSLVVRTQTDPPPSYHPAPSSSSGTLAYSLDGDWEIAPNDDGYSQFVSITSFSTKPFRDDVD